MVPSLNSISDSNFLFLDCLGIKMTFLSLYHLAKVLRSSSWFIFCYKGNPLQSIMLCPFCSRQPFVPMDMHNFPAMQCHSKWHVKCLPFSSFHFSFQPSIRGCPNYSTVQSPCDFLFLIWFSLQVLCPIVGPFIFWFLRLLYPVTAPGLHLCARCILLCKIKGLVIICSGGSLSFGQYYG